MKKLALISTLFGIGLVGCGGSSSESSTVKVLPNKVTIDEKNQIRVMSDIANPISGTIEKVDSSIKLGSQDSQVKFFAEANAPISIVEIYPVNDNAKLPSGWIHLDSITKQANLTFLAANESAKQFSLSCESKECFANTSYKIVDNRETSQLAIKFNGANNKYHNMLPSKFYPENHFYNTGSTGANISYQLSASSALVSGELNYSIPNQWAVMQKKRFPIIAVSGQLMLDGKAYRITSMSNGVSIGGASTGFNLVDDHGNEAYLAISVVTEDNSSYSAGIYVTTVRNAGFYTAFSPLSESVWVEKDGAFYFNWNQPLTSDMLSGSILLNVNLTVPTVKSQLTLNTQPLNFALYDGKTQAFARNEKKGYKLNIAGGYSLTITHEQKGHLSLSYQTADDTIYKCGDTDQVCAGLIVDSDQKTYHFNQVKVGSNTLNGSVFIPGVFE